MFSEVIWFSQYSVYSGCTTCLLQIKTNDKANKCINMVRDTNTNNWRPSRLGAYDVDEKLYLNYCTSVVVIQLTNELLARFCGNTFSLSMKLSLTIYNISAILQQS